MTSPLFHQGSSAPRSLLPVLYDLLGRLLWELRAAWANGRRVALTLEHSDVPRVEGIVTRISATGATATVGGMLVPLDRALAIHWASRLGDGARNGGRGAGLAPSMHPDQLPLTRAAQGGTQGPTGGGA